jgi:hypothetical protein
MSFTLLRRRKPTSGALRVPDSAFSVPPPLPAARQGHVAVLLTKKSWLVVFGGRGVTVDRRQGRKYRI